MATLTATKSKKRGQLVDTHHVEQLIGEYKKQRWVHNTERIGKVDSLSSWFGLDELSSFLELARENQADGIKMYFGVYPDSFTEEPEFIGRQTVVLVATKKSQSGYGITNKNIYINREGESQILAFNMSEICPPFCGTIPPSYENLGIETEKTGLTIIDHNGEIKIA